MISSHNFVERKMGNKFDRYFFEEIPCHRAFNKKIYGRVVNTINIWETVDEKMWGNTEGERFALRILREGKIYLLDRVRIVDCGTELCTCSKEKDHEFHTLISDKEEKGMKEFSEKGNEGMMIPVLFMGLLMVSASMILKKK